ncbi:MAG TPA: hypothetical protein VEG64_02965 [Candidatus Sulfotelmatobacter sp.]|nr:hypothetical protein [Candidatus Sulfotelmatobacter sp.]
MANLKFEISKKAEEKADPSSRALLGMTTQLQKSRQDAGATKAKTTAHWQECLCHGKAEAGPTTLLAGGLGFAADVGFEVGFVVR